MVTKEIVWSELGKIQFSSVLDFYVIRNGNANFSLKLVDEVEDLLNTLSKSHYLGRLTKNKITRVIILKTYLIYYEINIDRIEIVSFWDNRQDNINQKVQ